MTLPLNKPDLVRSAWITELRRQGDRQCIEAYEETGGLVCALGLLREVALPDATAREQTDCIEEIGELAGLNPQQSNEVAILNDGASCDMHTFAEIADVVEGWFK